MQIVYIILFYLTQILANISFKLSSNSQKEFWLYFIVGNILTLGSTYILTALYKIMNVNIAVAFCIGGSFLVVQLMLAYIFKTNLTLLHYIGIALIIIGISIFALGDKIKF